VETNGLAIFMTGQAQSESWMTSGGPVSFHHLSSLIRNIFNRFGIEDPDQNETDLPTFDYGLQYLYQGQVLANIGLVSGSLANLASVQQPVFYAYVHWPRLVANVRSAGKKERLVYRPISKFPEVRRDLSLVLDEQVPFSRVEEVIKQASSQLVRQINVFDIYQGEQLAEGEKAYAFSFILQDQDKTLTDTLIEKTMNKLMNTLKHELNATIRK
jgi:phenylalanyl-tRNA synthetase beta chain